MEVRRLLVPEVVQAELPEQFERLRLHLETKQVPLQP